MRIAVTVAAATALTLATVSAGAGTGDTPPREDAGKRPFSLMGRTASFKALAYDDPAKPLYDGLVHTATVTDAIEFGMGPEGVQNNLDVVPAIVDISASRIEISFALGHGIGTLVDSTFNGYLLAFEPDCLVIDRATVDPAATTMAIAPEDMTYEGRTLKINLAGRQYDPTSRIAIDLHADECPMT